LKIYGELDLRIVCRVGLGGSGVKHHFHRYFNYIFAIIFNYGGNQRQLNDL